MNEALRLLLAGLTTYRIAHMVALEDGPFEVFTWLRQRLGGDEQATWVGRGINCVLCIGFWSALLVAAWWFVPGWVGTLGLLWGGFSGFVLVMHRGLNK